MAIELNTMGTIKWETTGDVELSIEEIEFYISIFMKMENFYKISADSLLSNFHNETDELDLVVSFKYLHKRLGKFRAELCLDDSNLDMEIIFPDPTGRGTINIWREKVTK